MQFTYHAYEGLVSLLLEQGYAVKTYHTWQEAARCVILRHDIDTSLSKAVELARVEQELGVSSTYFVLLTSDFYNVASKGNLEKLRVIQSMGHELGLHFDETAYEGITMETMPEYIQREATILSDILGIPITTVSMHRPSRAILEADLKIPGMVNSYGKTFFHEFKYLSDSRRRWREPVEEIICSGEHDRLHILTHAFWYREREESIQETVHTFIQTANQERYQKMSENITDLQDILKER